MERDFSGKLMGRKFWARVTGKCTILVSGLVWLLSRVLGGVTRLKLTHQQGQDLIFKFLFL